MDIFEYIFRRYPPLTSTVDHALAVVQFTENAILGVVGLVIGIAVLWIANKNPRLSKKTTILCGVWILTVGIAFIARAVSYYYNYAVIDTILRAISALIGVWMFLSVPKGVAQKFEEEDLWKKTIEAATSAKFRADQAEAKADKLLEIVRKYESTYTE